MNTAAIFDSLTRIEANADRIRAECSLIRGEMSGSTIVPGTSLQSALDAARPGDILVLEPGATYEGALVFPLHEGGAAPITLKSGGSLPMRRITPEDRGQLATIAATGATVLDFTGKRGYILDGIALQTGSGSGDAVKMDLSAQIVLDRVLFVSPGQKNGVRANCTEFTIRRSHINSGVWAGQENHAVVTWQGARYLIEDNYLAASSISVLFGGGNNKSEAENPVDITVIKNHMHKPLEWKGQSAPFKNLFELKNAQRVRVDHNLFENSWTGGQTGFGVLFTPKQEGNNPWSVVRDVVFELNYIKNCERGMSLVGRNYRDIVGQMTNVVIRKNVIESQYESFQMGTEIGTLTLEDNVCDNSASLIAKLFVGTVMDESGQRPAAYGVGDLHWRQSAHRDVGYGIKADGKPTGTPSLDATMQAPYEFFEQGMVGLRSPSPYPATTYAMNDAEFQQRKAALLAEIGR